MKMFILGFLASLLFFLFNEYDVDLTLKTAKKW